MKNFVFMMMSFAERWKQLRR